MPQRKPTARDTTSKSRARDLRPISSAAPIRWDDLRSATLETGTDQPLEFDAMSNLGKKRGER